jgi:type IV pilus assembly protein PilX
MVSGTTKKQSGVALIASLLVLILVGLASVATMESTGMQLKMTVASSDRQEAFEVAEAALKAVEENIINNVDNLAEDSNMYLDCGGDGCFTASCANGRCFQGTMLSEDPEDCETVGDGNFVDQQETLPWESGDADDGYLNVWDDASLHLSVAVDGYTNPVRYIIEFRCFTPADPEVDLDTFNKAQLFRITTRGMSNSGRTEVMLQSTIKRT